MKQRKLQSWLHGCALLTQVLSTGSDVGGDCNEGAPWPQGTQQQLQLLRMQHVCHTVVLSDCTSSCKYLALLGILGTAQLLEECRSWRSCSGCTGRNSSPTQQSCTEQWQGIPGTGAWEQMPCSELEINARMRPLWCHAMPHNAECRSIHAPVLSTGMCGPCCRGPRCLQKKQAGGAVAQAAQQVTRAEVALLLYLLLYAPTTTTSSARQAHVMSGGCDCTRNACQRHTTQLMHSVGRAFVADVSVSRS